MISYEQIQLMGYIVQLERNYIKQYGSLFHNFSYRETGTVFVLQQTIEPTISRVPGQHGVDAEAKTVNLHGIELKSANQPAIVRFKKDGTRYKNCGHKLDHSTLVGKFDKMQSDERFERVQKYDAFAFSIYADRHLPEVVFYIKAQTGVEKIQKMIYDKRQEILKHSDTSSFKATTIDLKYQEIFDTLTDLEINILVDSSYIEETEEIRYIQISKEEYIQHMIGTEMPKGNVRNKHG